MKIRKHIRGKSAITFDNGLKPIISCMVDGHVVPFNLDTGSDRNIIFPIPSSGYIDQSKYQRILTLNNNFNSYRVNLKDF